MKKILIHLILFIAIPAFGQSTLTILHTNDIHSQIEPFLNHGAWVGGALNRYEYIKQIRKEQPNLLIVDAGDYSQGTPYFNLFKGEIEVTLMNEMGYEVATLGNHEFDNGLDALAQRLTHARYTTVCSNYKFHHPGLDTLIKPYTILYKEGKKIGIFGLLTDLTGLIGDLSFIEHSQYQDATATAQHMVDKLRDKEHCDLIICLSHLGFNPEREDNPICDKLVAQQVNGIDIIIGGHSHILMDKPVIINNTIIVQVGNKGNKIGRMDIHF